MEATPEQAVEGLAIVRVLSTVLDRLVGANAAIARADPGQVTKFHAMKAPGIGIQLYLERYVRIFRCRLRSFYSIALFVLILTLPFFFYRVLKYASCSNECFILALIYIDRLIQRNNFLLTELNVHRVVITAILLAAKFFDDAYYNNAYYAKVGGVLVSEMNGLEVDFLFRINFSLHVTPDVFEKYRAELLSHSTPAAVTMHTEIEQAPVHAQHIHSHLMPQTSMHAPPMHTQTGSMSHSQVLRAATQITPNPPREAGRVADDPMHVTSQNRSADEMMMGSHDGHGYTVDYFPTNNTLLPILQRSNSMPVQKHSPSNYYRPQCATVPLGAGRCSQNSLSAPPMVSGQYSNSAVVDDHQYAVMQNQIYPLQNTLIHHNHNGFAQHVPSDGGYPPRDGAHRLVSGAGL
jgi:hypothetical protein